MWSILFGAKHNVEDEIFLVHCFVRPFHLRLRFFLSVWGICARGVGAEVHILASVLVDGLRRSRMNAWTAHRRYGDILEVARVSKGSVTPRQKITCTNKIPYGKHFLHYFCSRF